VFKSSKVILFLFLFVLFLTAGKATYAVKVDPTRPFGHKASSVTASKGNKLVLESIIHGNGISTVVISGKVLKILDYIGEYQLTDVNKESVVLRSKTERIKLSVLKRNVVKVSVAK
jgi:MSHA biogenesis protein MshK